MPQRKLTAETAAMIWQGVLDRLDGMVSDQAAMFEDVAISAPNRLVVRFPAKYTSCRQFCERPEQKAILREALSKATGEPIELEFAAEGNASTAAVSSQTRTVAMRQLQAEVIGRPIVRRAMELFEVQRPRVDFPQS